MARTGILRFHLFLISFLFGMGHGIHESISQVMPIKINPSDQAEMVWIPEGEFIRGSNAEELKLI